jgi:quercetin dioxygenase-like cupin family protein
MDNRTAVTSSQARLREAPADRLRGAEHLIILSDAVATLRAEARETIQGHRQITLLHGRTLRLVLFAFDARGELSIPEAPGPLTLHGLSGTFRVRTPDEVYELSSGHLLLFDAGVSVDIDAIGEADLLLGISMYDAEPSDEAELAARRRDSGA